MQPYYKIILGFVLIVNLKLLISYKKKKSTATGYKLQAARKGCNVTLFVPSL